MVEYYTKSIDENGNITFKLVDFDHVTICGHTLNEVIKILNGLEFERITGIKITMENLQILCKKLMEEQKEKFEETLVREFKEYKNDNN